MCLNVRKKEQNNGRRLWYFLFVQFLYKRNEWIYLKLNFTFIHRKEKKKE